MVGKAPRSNVARSRESRDDAWLFRTEQLQALRRQTIPVLVANVAVGGIVCVAFSMQTHGLLVAVWFALLAAMVVVRWTTSRRAEALARTMSPAEAVIGSACAGALWGSAAVAFFVPGNLLLQMLLILAVGGMAAGAATTLPAYLPAFYSYLVPALAPLVVRIGWEGNAVHLWSASMLSLYGVLLAFVGFHSNRRTLLVVKAARENKALVKQLEAAVHQADLANQSLEQRVRERTAQLEASMASQRVAEQELRQAERMDALGKLTGGVAHDFNNLLTVIGGSVELLDSEPDPTKKRKLIDDTRLAVARAGRLTQSLLAFARKAPLRPEALGLADFLESRSAFLRRLLPENVELQLGPLDRRAMLFVDSSRLENALINLTANARDAMPNGGIVRIDVQLQKERSATARLDPSQWVQISVSDEGSGIPEAHHDRIFEPFFTTKDPGRGTGLGLSVVHSFCQQSGGEIRLRSATGCGTTMILRFPASSEKPVPDQQQAMPSSPWSDDRSVLIVEDDAFVSRIATKMFETLGFAVRAAPDGEAALNELATGGPVDLVFSDVVMPGQLDGRGLARQLFKAFPKVRVLLTSGYPDKFRRDVEAEQWFVLPKPYTQQTLRDAISDLFGSCTRDRAEASAAWAHPGGSGALSL